MSNDEGSWEQGVLRYDLHFPCSSPIAVYYLFSLLNFTPNAKNVFQVKHDLSRGAR